MAGTHELSPAAAARPTRSVRARLSGGLLVLPGVGWLLAFFLLPLLIIFVVSFGSKDATGHVVLTDLGLRNYIEATKPEFLPAFANSVRYSFLTTVLSLVIGYPIATGSRATAAGTRSCCSSWSCSRSGRATSSGPTPG